MEDFKTFYHILSFFLSILCWKLISAQDFIGLGELPGWQIPCITSDIMETPNVPLDPERKEEKKSYERIKVQLENAKTHFEQWKDAWAQSTFSETYAHHFSDWQTTHPDSEYKPIFSLSISSSDSKIPILNKERRNILQDVRERFQKIGVWLEQVLLDAMKQNNSHYQSMLDTYTKLNLILCEVDVTMYQLAIPKKLDIEREFLPEYERNEYQQIIRDRRDFTVFQNYSYALDYSQKAIDYLLDISNKYYVNY